VNSILQREILEDDEVEKDFNSKESSTFLERKENEKGEWTV
jgi:hypothetical protein